MLNKSGSCFKHYLYTAKRGFMYKSYYNYNIAVTIHMATCCQG